MSAAAKKPVEGGHWSNYSDEELLRADFIYLDDPRLQIGIISELPDGAEFSSIVNRYKSRDDVKCIFGHIHKEGVTVKLSDHSLVLMGLKCGQNEFGEDMRIADKDLQYAEQRKRYLQWQIRVLNPLERAIISCRDWEPQCREFLRNRISFRKNAEELFAEASNATMYRHSQLTVEEHRRDFAAEEIRDLRQGKSSNESGKNPIFTSQVIWQKALRHPEFFDPSPPLNVLRQSEISLQRILEKLRQNQLSNHELGSCRIRLRQTCESLLSVAAQIGSSCRISRDQTFKDIAEFGNLRNDIPGQYFSDDRGLFRLNDEKCVLIPSRGIEAPDITNIETLLSSLDGR